MITATAPSSPIDVLNWEEGFVVTLDCAGVRGLSKDGSIEFLRKWKEVVDSLDADAYQPGTPVARESVVQMQKFVLGDMIVLLWPQREPRKHILTMGGIVSALLGTGLRRGLFLRAAIDHGEYCVQDLGNKGVTILGSPVIETVAMHESLQMLGCTVCGGMTGMIDWFEGQIKPDLTDPALGRHFVRYETVFKDAVAGRMSMQIAWPWTYIINANGEVETARKTFLEEFAVFKYPTKEYPKYASTIKFFDWYCKAVKISPTALEAHRQLVEMGVIGTREIQ
ncbi:MAG: hypothetical protein ABI743_03525 [bacterium]